VPLAGFQQRQEQGLIDVHPDIGQFDHQLVQLPAKLLAADAAGAGRRAQSARRQHGQADAREQTAAGDAAQPRQHAVLRAFDVHRQQGGVGLVGGQRRQFVNFHQRAGQAEPSLGEHRHPFAGLDVLDQRFQIVRGGGIDADVAGDGDERLDPPLPGDVSVDDENRHVRQERRQQHAVQIGHMVGDDQQAGFMVGIVLPAA